MSLEVELGIAVFLLATTTVLSYKIKVLGILAGFAWLWVAIDYLAELNTGLFLIATGIGIYILLAGVYDVVEET